MLLPFGIYTFVLCITGKVGVRSIKRGDMKLGLVLEGGGARGAFQAGAIQAFLVNGYSFKGVTGTSIGALNGAMLAQNSFEKSYDLWKTMEFNKLFDFESKHAEALSTMTLSTDTIKYFFLKLKEAVANKGLSTTKIRSIIDEYIDEDKLRSSGIDFGIMTISFTELKPYELFVEDMPRGKVGDYIMASANFPGFSKMEIGDKVFIDGGLYDNRPINMLINRGYYDIIVMETKSIMPKQKIKNEVGAQIAFLKPSEKPGRMLDFNPEPVARAMRIGHFDAMRFMHGYVGESYYLTIKGISPFGYGLADFDDDIYYSVANVCGFKAKIDNKDEAIEYIINYVSKRNKKKYIDIISALLHLIERAAELVAIERLEIYDFKIFIELIDGNLSEGIAKTVKQRIDFNAYNIISNALHNQWHSRIL